MKYVKMLGLAAVAAAALMAFVGAGTASATVLCTSPPDASGNCPAGAAYAAETTIHATLEPGTSAELRAGFATITCTESTVHGKTANAGGAAETVRGPIETLSFNSCNATVNVTTGGELEIHPIGHTGNGTLTSKGAVAHVSTLGTTCTYGTQNAVKDIGTLTGGAEPTLHANVNLEKIAGGFLCANPASWTASYIVTSPHALYVTTS
jgi:hypothetical protein